MIYKRRLLCMVLCLCVVIGVAGAEASAETDYALWIQSGSLTGWGGVRRQGQGYGEAEITQEKLSIAWDDTIPSTLGTCHETQPMIVKWPAELRKGMNLYSAVAETVALKEVIVAGQDGKLSFYNLLDGTPTRDAVDVEASFTGTPSIAPNGLPLLLAATEKGMLLLNLATGQTGFVDQGSSVDSPIFLTNHTTIRSQQIVYIQTTGELNVTTLKHRFDYSSLDIQIYSVGQQSFPLAEESAECNSGLAWDGKTLYGTTDDGQLIRFDIATAKSGVIVKLKGTGSVTPMLDDNGNLYVSSSGDPNTGKTSCYLQSFGPDGTQRWCCQIDGEPTDDPQYPAWNGLYPAWCEATATLGAGDAEGMVFFTVSGGNSGVYALNAETGELLWHRPIAASSLNGSVLVQAVSGKAYLLQTGDVQDPNGTLYLLDARSGEQRDALQLEGQTINLPAVYRNMAVIATYDRRAEVGAKVYGILLE